jgi:Gpi18-like mannosyltransferase
MYALAVIFKPQAIMLAPVVGLAYVYALFKKGGLGKAVLGIFSGLAAAAAVFALFIWPFTGTQPVTWVVGKYADAIGYYHYASINAFNVYTLFGLNWGAVPTFTLFGQQIEWGMVALVLICVLIVILQWRSREQRRFFDLAAFLVISVFMLMHGMHERYMIPACVCLIFAYICSRDSVTLCFAAGFSIYALLNEMLTLYASSVVAPETPTRILSAIGVAMYAVYAVVTVRKLWSRKVLIKTPALQG